MAALLAGGFLLGALAERLRQSSILGYLIAGMVLGPHGLRVVPQSATVALLAELGVAMLLFSIGLEFSWSRLRRTGGAALWAGAVQVALTVVLAVVAGLLTGANPRVAFVLGAALALSSTAYVLRVLTNRAQLDSERGRLSVGLLLVQDIAVVPLVLVLSVLRTGEGPAAAVLALGRLLALSALLVGGFFVLFHVLVPRLLGTEVLRRNRELPLLLATASGLGAAIVAHSLGLSPAIGAFLAGMLLAESPFATQVRADISALRTLLMMLFFGSIGMFGDPAGIARELLPVGGYVLAVVTCKALIVYLALRLFRKPARVSLATGISLAQIGEFSFVLADLARGSLLDERLFQAVVSTTIVTLFATPYLIRFAPAIADRILRKAPAPATAPEGTQARGHVVVIGFGPTGQAVARALHSRGDSVHVLDLNARSIEEARRLGYHAHHGDAAHPEVLQHVGVERAVAIAVTLPDPEAARTVTEQVRAMASCARVFARSRYHIHGPRLQQAGAHVVVDEEEQVGRALAEALLSELDRLG